MSTVAGNGAHTSGTDSGGQSDGNARSGGRTNDSSAGSNATPTGGTQQTQTTGGINDVGASGGTVATSGGTVATSGGTLATSGGTVATSGGTLATSGSSSAGSSGESSASDDPPPGYVPAVVGVGYGGLRIVSRDGGLTWGSRASIAPKGGDDDNLIRAVAYGKGRWVATGWRLWTSDDGVTWTDHGKLHDGIVSDQQIIEGLAYKDGYFYAAGDGNPSKLYRSSDGISWTRHATIGNTVKHTGLAYRGGLLVSYGDSHTSYQSTDGERWTEMSGIQDATYCEGQWKSLKDCFNAAWFDAGYYLLDEWGGFIRRSSNGQTFKNVYADDQQNTLYRSRALAQGFAAPR